MNRIKFAARCAAFVLLFLRALPFGALGFAASFAVEFIKLGWQDGKRFSR